MLRTLILGLLVACSLSLPPLADGPRTLPATESWSTQLDLVLPTDLVAVDGGLAVLDGYTGRLWPVGADGALGEPRASDALRGAVRMAPSNDGGFWVAAPDGGDAGEVRRLDADLKLVRATAVPGAVAVLGQADGVVVGLRHGGLVWLGAQGDSRLRTTEDVDGAPFGAIADLARAPDGGVFAVDALGHRVHHLTEQGVPTTFVGDFGLWIGRMSKPKAVAVGPGDTLVVVDSALSAVQLFDLDGKALGALALDGEILQPAHPMAVHADGERLVVLDARGRLHGLSLTEAAVQEARDNADLRHLRHPLIDPAEVKRAAGEARLCLQCHDGVVNDDRYVWDPALGHHPVGVVPDSAVPAAFPVDDDGAIRCGTCHSPHGTSELAAVRAVDDPDARSSLVRHQAGADDLFTRLSREDSALCLGCHDDAAHDQVLAELGLGGGAHPVGEALARALAERPGQSDAGLPPGIGGSCLTCHTPHGAARGALGRDAAGGAVCVACHEGAAHGQSHPLAGTSPSAAASAELPLAENGGPTCLTCHALVAGEGESLLRAPADGTPLCRSCHRPDGPAAAPPSHPPHGTLKQGCLSCHDVHDAAGEAHLLAHVGTSSDPQACATCHAAPGKRGHPIGVPLPSGLVSTDLEPGVAHGNGALTCATCHDAHTPTEPRTTCAECHAEPAAAAARGGHGGQDCLACHPAHDAAPAGPARANPSERACLACHGPGGSATRIASWSHDAPVFDGDGPRWEPLRGLLLVDSRGQPVPPEASGTLSCISCHEVHGPHAGEPGDHLRKPGWEEPCGACHGQKARELYRWFHDPERRKP